MHDCPDCGQACYCDLDDSNDCRDNGECFHGCEPEDEEDFNDDWAAASCAGCSDPVSLGGETCGALECGGKRLPGAADESAPNDATKGGSRG